MKRELQGAIKKYIDMAVTQPALSLVMENFQLQDDIASILTMNRILKNSVKRTNKSELDEYLVKLINDDLAESVDELFILGSKNKHQDAFKVIYIGYITQLISSISIQILSASYLSANIISRSILETLVNVSSKSTGTMSDKIESLSFLEADRGWGYPSAWEGHATAG